VTKKKATGKKAKKKRKRKVSPYRNEGKTCSLCPMLIRKNAKIVPGVSWLDAMNTEGDPGDDGKRSQ